MKIQFIKPHRIMRGYFSPTSLIKTQWGVDRYNRAGSVVIEDRDKNKKIIKEINIIKQPSKLKTLRVIFHELGHVFITLLLRDKKSYHQKWDNK